LWRTTSLESFRSETPDWDVLIDLDALAAKEGEDWIWRGGVTLPGTHNRAIVQLSRGGSDAVVLREFDLATRDFAPEGFYLSEAKSSIAWARPRYAAFIVAARAWHGDPDGLCAHYTGMAARERSARVPGTLAHGNRSMALIVPWR
jgi:prolyl oligopeptidase PreP (S9A serine peptidase family)